MSRREPHPVAPRTRTAFLVRLLSNTLSQQVERALKPLSLTQAQLAALAQLTFTDEGWLSGAELGRRAGVTAQAMSAAITDLERRDLVRRSPHPTQGRIQRVHITEDGAHLLERAQQLTEPVDARALALLTEPERDQFRSLLLRVMTASGCAPTAEPEPGE
ncbi:MarR family transcriptional regulator [Kitasatospora sp. NPDC096077]|uniref:MarR family winged helix-turn-helix transcriptional regulator n=1 Tax=Kitasatospora sp. NPDC096077 TaxID=3155544 RepID=UPI00332D64D1